MYQLRTSTCNKIANSVQPGLMKGDMLVTKNTTYVKIQHLSSEAQSFVVELIPNIYHSFNTL